MLLRVCVGRSQEFSGGDITTLINDLSGQWLVVRLDLLRCIVR